MIKMKIYKRLLQVEREDKIEIIEINNNLLIDINFNNKIN